MLLAIGSSHLTALLSGFKLYCRENPAPFELQHLQLQKPVYKPFLRRQGDEIVYNSRLRQDLAAAIAADGVERIVCCIGGAVHTVVGLVNHPRPFDLLLPGSTVDDTAAGADIIAYDLVAASIRRRAAMQVHLLRLVMTLADGLPVVQLCPPPPVARDDLILGSPSGFAAALAEHGEPPAPLRLKLWRTYCNVLAEMCDELGAPCLAAPSRCLDPAGFLREEFWGADPTHANAQYGALVVEQLLHSMAGVPA